MALLLLLQDGGGAQGFDGAVNEALSALDSPGAQIIRATALTEAGSAFDVAAVAGTLASSIIERAQRINLLPNSESFADFSPFNAGTGTPGVKTVGFAMAPDSTMTACRIQGDRGTGSTNGDHSGVRFILTADTRSVWVKSNTGVSQQFSFFRPNSDAIVTATDQWQRLSYTLVGGTVFDILAIGTAATRVLDILIWHPQMEAGLAATEYIPTNGTSAAGYAYDTASGGMVTSASRVESVALAEALSAAALLAASSTEMSIAGEVAEASQSGGESLVTESASMTDFVAASMAAIAAAAEISAASNILSSAMTAQVSASDAAAASDQIGSLQLTNGSVSEPSSATELSTQGTLSSAVAIETGIASDAVSAIRLMWAAAVEGVSGSDAASSAALYLGSAVEAAAAGETTTSASVRLTSLLEAVASGDVLGAALIAQLSISETATASDTIAAAKIISGSIIDAAAAIDSAQGEAVYTGVLMEIGSSIEAMAAGVVLAAVVTETSVAGEAIEAMAEFYASAIDAATAGSVEIGFIIVPGVALGTVFVLASPTSVFNVIPASTGGGDTTIFTLSDSQEQSWQLKPQ